MLMLADKCSCNAPISKDVINYLCIGPSIPVCSCVDSDCTVILLLFRFVCTLLIYVCMKSHLIVAAVAVSYQLNNYKILTFNVL